MSSRPRPVVSPGEPSAVQWVVVPEMMWTGPDAYAVDIPSVVLPFPMGSADRCHGIAACSKTR